MIEPKIGVSKRLEIRVYPFKGPFEINLFVSHVTHRTAAMFVEYGRVIERCFVAVTAVDYETQAPPSTLAIIVPKWKLGTRDEVYADVREYLARSKGIAVSSAAETPYGVTVSVEWNGQRSAFAAMKTHDAAGQLVLARWERVGAGVALPLLPTAPGNLQ